MRGAVSSGADKTPHGAYKASSNWQHFFCFLSLMPHATCHMAACWSLQRAAISCRARSRAKLMELNKLFDLLRRKCKFSARVRGNSSGPAERTLLFENLLQLDTAATWSWPEAFATYSTGFTGQCTVRYASLLLLLLLLSFCLVFVHI